MKDGPVLGADSDCIKGLKNGHIDVVNLANNHIMDHGPAGLRNTMSLCDKEGIACVGAGENLAAARKVLVRRIRGMRIGIMGVAEHEFSIATEDGWGANPLDIMGYIRNVRDHNDEWDYLIVLLHGGKEYYPYPSPRLRDICRFMVEEGANAVICQHSHCPGCYEAYKGGHIVYGQGNLIFDAPPNRDKACHQGFLVRLEIGADCKSTMQPIPYLQCDVRVGARKMDAGEEKIFKDELDKRSRQIADVGFVEHKWLKYCRSQKCLYFSQLRGHNRLLCYLNRKTRFTEWLYSRRSRLMQRNVVESESLREVLETLWRNSGSGRDQ